MDALQRTLNIIISSLRGLSTTARLLIGSLVIILAMTLFLVALYAGRSSMVPLPITLTADSRSRALTYLEHAQIPHQLRGGELHVPATRRYSILAELTDSEIITTDEIDFTTLFESDNPFTSNADKRRRYLVATMSVVETMLKHTQDIVDARVVISEPERATPIGQPDIRPSATVTVRLRNGALDQARADAIARIVAGSHASLTTDRVEVVDASNLRAFRPRTDDHFASTQYIEVQLAAERHLAQKLRDHLDYIPGVRIAVNAQVDATRVEARRDNYDEAKIAPLAESSRSTTATNTAMSGEPGMRTNVGLAIGSVGRQGSEFADERSDARLKPMFGGEKQHIVDNRGYPLKINATISVPRSYYVGIFRNVEGNPDAMPDDPALADIEQEVLMSIQATVAPLIETDTVAGGAPGTVQVGTYHDFALASLAGFGSPTSGTGIGGGSPVTEHLVRYVGLGGLAVISLAMMFLMVRRATARQDLPTAEELVGVTPTLQVDDSDMMGEASETPAALEGVEVDEEDLRRQQMLEQIDEMARNDAEVAAGLLKRWIRSDHFD